MARILLFSCPTAQKLHKITYSETSYSILDREIAAMHWHFADSEPTNSAKKQRALALHGWLDNAASFSPMAGFLKNTELTAIDMAGQGKSDFRSRDGNYDLVSELRDLFELCTSFAEGPVNLVGHSRGAIVSALFAAIVPEKVNRLVLIDSIEPFPHKITDLPKALADCLRSNYSLESRTGTTYPKREDAIQARINSAIPVSQKSAELLAERSLRQVENGWTWHADQRLKATNAYRITDEMRGNFFSLLRAPTLVIEPKNGMLKLDPRFKESGAAIANLSRKEVPGAHHCHMDDCPELVAELVDDWLCADLT